MKILQVVFKLQNSNVDDINNLIKNNNYTKNIVFDFKENEEIFENVKEYDYIIFANPNFYMDQKSIASCLNLIDEKKSSIFQYSLLDEANVKQKYIENNYRELFSPIILSTKNIQESNLLKLYFELILEVEDKAFVTTNYIGRDLRNKWHKEDLINLTIYLLNYSEISNLMKKFKDEGQFIKFLDLVIDNQVFERYVDKDKQFELLNLFRKKLQNFPLIRQRKYTNLYLFYNLVNKGYLEEAIKSLELYRSRRYWYHVSKNMEESMKREPSNIRTTKAWLTTQKLRNFRLNTEKTLRKSEKFILKIIAKIYKLLNKKEVWLLGERLDSASDNAYFLFEYLQNQQNDIKSFYLIDRNKSKELDKLKGNKNILNFATYKHKLFMLIADKYITAFTIEENMLPFNSKEYKKIYKKELEGKKVISIQHGMIMNNISPYLNKKHYMINYITANNLAEKEIIMQTLGFNSDEILITGMARQDNLLDNSRNSNEILFMPTWQRGLQNLTPTQFLSTEYFKKINEMLEDKNILDFLLKNNLKLKVLMHPQFEKFSEYLNSKNVNIEFLSTKETEISEMIVKCQFLITDFSSIAADFLFQKKNVIFYQYNKHALHHVPTKQIKYDDIGQVVENLDELTESLNKIEKNKFELLDEFNTSYKMLFNIKGNIREKIVNDIKKLK
ncbi:CDP-glycerol:poly(glycerophosphate) glycerophosphotransferase [Staphylococcus xylosus]|uniref:CDP-glycerol glycerophosphotransferase family protein n=1 Tax=Staphylococcus xylosus TaxID=1288 RepID=UPI00085C5E70|nr:CDP-glycerol glycerophosphotransferase family protein [Staphylococcus xylosus]SCU15372.1 CDP-glycerol:poly(glycerophosphate) glycerophosphotransferase [Staphylococcus xylosus]